MQNYSSQENLIDPDGQPERQKSSRNFAILLPVSIFLGIVVLLAIGLTMDPRKVPSPLIDKPVPTFSLAPVQGRQLGLASNDLKGEVSLVNVFASWCVACRQEHPLLLEVGRQNIVPIHGLNYKDEADDAAGWLDALGDPYTRTGADLNGRVGIDWGVYGAPETFLINADGIVLHKHLSPLTEAIWQKEFKPRILATKGSVQ
jgi:cytochrome c biogenesis protein CcmG/thiol:disulfide interchange protein DsbE